MNYTILVSSFKVYRNSILANKHGINIIPHLLSAGKPRFKSSCI